MKHFNLNIEFHICHDSKKKQVFDGLEKKYAFYQNDFLVIYVKQSFIMKHTD